MPESHSNISTEVLASYAVGELPAAEADAVARAIAASEPLRRRAMRVREMVDLLAASEIAEPPREVVRRVLGLVGGKPAGAGWLDRVVDAVATLVFDSRAGAAIAGFRGASATQGRLLTYECEKAEVDLEVTPAGAGRFRVQGQVTGGQANGEVGFVGSAGRVTVRTDARGLFVTELDAGTWEVRVAVGERVVALPPITLE